jgi:hypothetical protein
MPEAVSRCRESRDRGLLRVQFQSDLPQLLLQFPAQALRFLPALEPKDRMVEGIGKIVENLGD